MPFCRVLLAFSIISLILQSIICGFSSVDEHCLCQSDSDTILIQVLVVIKGWSVGGPVLILLKTSETAFQGTLCLIQKEPYKLLSYKMLEMVLSGSHYYIQHRYRIYDHLCWLRYNIQEMVRPKICGQ